MGLVNYHHRVFVKNYTKVAVPLYALENNHSSRKKRTNVLMKQSSTRMLTTAPELTLPNSTDRLMLAKIYASDIALGAKLENFREAQEIETYLLDKTLENGRKRQGQ